MYTQHRHQMKQAAIDFPSSIRLASVSGLALFAKRLLLVFCNLVWFLLFISFTLHSVCVGFLCSLLRNPFACCFTTFSTSFYPNELRCRMKWKLWVSKIIFYGNEAAAECTESQVPHCCVLRGKKVVRSLLFFGKLMLQNPIREYFSSKKRERVKKIQIWFVATPTKQNTWTDESIECEKRLFKNTFDPSVNLNRRFFTLNSLCMCVLFFRWAAAAENGPRLGGILKCFIHRKENQLRGSATVRIVCSIYIDFIYFFAAKAAGHSKRKLHKQLKLWCGWRV